MKFCATIALALAWALLNICFQILRAYWFVQNAYAKYYAERSQTHQSATNLVAAGVFGFALGEFITQGVFVAGVFGAMAGIFAQLTAEIYRAARRFWNAHPRLRTRVRVIQYVLDVTFDWISFVFLAVVWGCVGLIGTSAVLADVAGSETNTLTLTNHQCLLIIIAGTLTGLLVGFNWRFAASYISSGTSEALWYACTLVATTVVIPLTVARFFAGSSPDAMFLVVVTMYVADGVFVALPRSMDRTTLHHQSENSFYI